MNVSLTKELETFVSRKVKSGRYRSASEVIRESLRLLEREDQRKQFSFSSREELEAKLVKELTPLIAARWRQLGRSKRNFAGSA